MKAFMLLMRVTIVILLVFFMMRLGLKFLIMGVRFWYITIPGLLLIYLIISYNRKRHKSQSSFFDSYDPNKEVKPEKEPEVTDIDDDNNGDNN